MTAEFALLHDELINLARGSDMESEHAFKGRTLSELTLEWKGKIISITLSIADDI